MLYKKYLLYLVCLPSFLFAAAVSPQDGFDFIAKAYRLKENVVINQNNFQQVVSLLKNDIKTKIEAINRGESLTPTKEALPLSKEEEIEEEIEDNDELDLDERVTLHAQNSEVIKEYKQKGLSEKLTTMINTRQDASENEKQELINKTLRALVKKKLKEYELLLSTPHLTHDLILKHKKKSYNFYDQSKNRYSFPDFNNDYKELITTFFWNKPGTDRNNFHNNYYLAMYDKTNNVWNLFVDKVSNFKKPTIKASEDKNQLSMCQELTPFTEGIILKTNKLFPCNYATSYNRCYDLSTLNTDQESAFIKIMLDKEKEGARFALVSGEQSITKYFHPEKTVKRFSFQGCKTLLEVLKKANGNKWIERPRLARAFWHNLIPLAPGSYSNIKYFTGWDLDEVKIYNELFENPTGNLPPEE